MREGSSASNAPTCDAMLRSLLDRKSRNASANGTSAAGWVGAEGVVAAAAAAGEAAAGRSMRTPELAAEAAVRLDREEACRLLSRFAAASTLVCALTSEILRVRIGPGGGPALGGQLLRSAFFVPLGSRTRVRPALPHSFLFCLRLPWRARAMRSATLLADCPPPLLVESTMDGATAGKFSA